MQKRVVTFDRIGPPEVLNLISQDVREPGRDEVRIDVKALGLNRAEALFRQGAYLESPSLPSRIGYEAAGIIEAIGSDVANLAPGDVVSVVPAFQMGEHGVYGESAVVPARAVVKHSASLSFEQAAAFWMQYMTAFGGLVDVGGLSKGQTVIITAASSSVGIAAIQIAKANDAQTIATTRGQSKKQRLLEAGADHVIVTDEEDLASRVSEITGGRGADLIFDPVAGDTLGALADAAAVRGTIIVYGALNAAAPEFPLFAALGKGLSFRGYTLFELSNDDERLSQAVDALNALLISNKLKVVIDKTFKLDEIAEAHRYLEASGQIGKIVVTV